MGGFLDASNATGANGDGTNNSASNSGAAYEFLRNAGSWSQKAYLKASNTRTNDYFGISVGISLDTVVSGAFGEASNATGVGGTQSDNSATSAGAAYVFLLPPAVTLAPTSNSAPATGATGETVLVNTDASYAWTASSNDAWLTITAGASGTGNGTVTYDVAATSGATRTGTLTIGGAAFNVTQLGIPATVTLSPTSDSETFAGASGNTVTVTVTPSDFSWTAASNAAWLTITAGASTTGSGTVTYSVAANTSASGFADPADGNFEDWFELYNPGGTPGNMWEISRSDIAECVPRAGRMSVSRSP